MGWKNLTGIGKTLVVVVVVAVLVVVGYFGFTKAVIPYLQDTYASGQVNAIFQITDFASTCQQLILPNSEGVNITLFAIECLQQ